MVYFFNYQMRIRVYFRLREREMDYDEVADVYFYFYLCSLDNEDKTNSIYPQLHNKITNEPGEIWQ